MYASVFVTSNNKLGLVCTCDCMNAVLKFRNSSRLDDIVLVMRSSLCVEKRNSIASGHA